MRQAQSRRVHQPKPKRRMNYLSVCCIAKDEHPFIREWINHHLLVGAEKIIIFDNGSSPGLRDSVREYVEHGFVDLFEIQGKEQQIIAYDCCLREYEGKTKWIAFIDVDEFLIPKKYTDVRMILTDYEDFGGLGVHWVEFGSSGHLTRPEGMQLKSYVHRFPLDHPKNMHIKSIVQPGRVKSACDPHQFIYNEPWFCVDENNFPLAESQGPFTARDIQLNHYYYRSQEDYCRKLDRGRADRADEDGKRRHEAFFPQLTRATILDTCADKFAREGEAILSNFELLKSTITSRSSDKKSLQIYYDKIFKNLSLGKTEIARYWLKKVAIHEKKSDIVDYVNFKICKKENDLNNSIKCLHKILQRHTDYDSCIEYTKIQVHKKKLDEAKSMLSYIKWRFRDILKSDTNMSQQISRLDQEINDRINTK
ncbi:MAG: glycosyltransferase family 92 protein [Desulfomicrobium sp.]|nr:glycosyltransferase family 92 protein [Pseudomonadota bacterium]MBU4594999.1 glycosyltransferase family 92 protein [Pseudomonadota bacterium]MBV1711229.1 glycosyltransferase family 92 protein [Desulfomicrobium sp.]MBV1746883.1 glycosyltransferase family 92 protein [Desulfomicrobium sp.]